MWNSLDKFFEFMYLFFTFFFQAVRLWIYLKLVSVDWSVEVRKEFLKGFALRHFELKTPAIQN